MSESEIILKITPPRLPRAAIDLVAQATRFRVPSKGEVDVLNHEKVNLYLEATITKRPPFALMPVALISFSISCGYRFKVEGCKLLKSARHPTCNFQPSTRN